MSNDSNKPASAVKVEKLGRMLSGLLADESEFDRRALWRIGWWGAAAVAAVMVAVLANQAALGWRRDRTSASDISRQAQLIQSLARETQSESRQLASAVETLNNDRDRLYARITVLEQGLESVTGTLAKQNTAQSSVGSGNTGKAASAAGQIATADSLPASSRSPSPQTGAQSAAASGPGSTGPTGTTPSQPSANPATSGSTATTPPPVVTPVATTTAAITDKPRPEVTKETSKASPTPTTASQAPQTASAASASSSSPPAPVAPSQIASTAPNGPAAVPLVAPRSIMAPPDPAATRLSEPDTLAKGESALYPNAAAKTGDAADTAAAAVQRTEFAVDLGSANSLNGLRALWRGLSKINVELAALRPIIMLKEATSGGLGMQLRLGAGPLNDAAAAAKICASLAESQRPCETTVFDGQRLAIRSDEGETPEAGKDTAKQPAPGATQQQGGAQKTVVPQRRRGAYQQQRHGAWEEPSLPPQPAPPAPPKPPEASTLSSLFHRQ